MTTSMKFQGWFNSGMVEEKHNLVTYHAINHVVYNSSCVMSLGLTHK